jgi:hypothetical protein
LSFRLPFCDESFNGRRFGRKLFDALSGVYCREGDCVWPAENQRLARPGKYGTKPETFVPNAAGSVQLLRAGIADDERFQPGGAEGSTRIGRDESITNEPEEKPATVGKLVGPSVVRVLKQL